MFYVLVKTLQSFLVSVSLNFGKNDVIPKFTLCDNEHYDIVDSHEGRHDYVRHC